MRRVDVARSVEKGSENMGSVFMKKSSSKSRESTLDGVGKGDDSSATLCEGLAPNMSAAIAAAIAECRSGILRRADCGWAYRAMLETMGMKNADNAAPTRRICFLNCIFFVVSKYIAMYVLLSVLWMFRSRYVCRIAHKAKDILLRARIRIESKRA
jgi:hypothetical protein